MNVARALAGVDGCRGGWIAAVERPGEGNALLVAPRFADLLAALSPDAILAVDMPIGLPDCIEGAGRAAEIASRSLLPPGRRSSLFFIPARTAVEAGAGPFGNAGERSDAFRRVTTLSRETSSPSRAVSIQGFCLFPRIMELDTLLRADSALAARVFESHPEIAFARLNGGEAMRHPKKRGGRVFEDAMAERRALLLAHALPPALITEALPRGAGEDDRLDACALLLVARRIAGGTAQSFPDPPGRDRFGLPVAIWA